MCTLKKYGVEIRKYHVTLYLLIFIMAFYIKWIILRNKYFLLVKKNIKLYYVIFETRVTSLIFLPSQIKILSLFLCGEREREGCFFLSKETALVLSYKDWDHN